MRYTKVVLPLVELRIDVVPRPACSCFGIRVLGFEIRFSGFGSPCTQAHLFGFWISCFVCRVPCFGFRVSGFGSRVSGFGFQISGFGFRNSCFVFRVSGLGFRVAGFGFRVQGFGFRCGLEDSRLLRGARPVTLCRVQLCRCTENQ